MIQEFRKIKIGEADFEYDMDISYEDDGHVYCRTCHERIDSKELKMFEKSYVFKIDCDCIRKEKAIEEERERRRKVNDIKDYCFLNSEFKTYTFDNYLVLDDERKRQLKIAKNYVDNYETMKKDNIGILFYGNVGSGKTYLAYAIANAIIEKYQIYVKITNFANIINDLQKGSFAMDKNEYISSICRSNLLILDDLGIERNTSYALEQVYNIVNSRYIQGKPTIITTNLSLEDMNNKDNSIEYQRIYSRILEMCIPVQICGKDFRIEINERKIAKARKLLMEGR